MISFLIFLLVFIAFIVAVVVASNRNRREDFEISEEEEKAHKIIQQKLIQENLVNNKNNFYVIGEDSNGNEIKVLAMRKPQSESSGEMQFQNSIS